MESNISDTCSHYMGKRSVSARIAFWYSVNIALNIASTVAKSLMRKNLIQRRTRSFDLSISLLVTFSSFCSCCCWTVAVFFMTLLAYSLELASS